MSEEQKSALVVDDDVIIRMDACDILTEAGFQAYEASHSDEALTFLQGRAGDITLLFTDVDMPGGSMNGFGLAREVASHWPKIGILVASAHHSPGPCEVPNAAIFVPKPFGGDVVMIACVSSCRRSGSRSLFASKRRAMLVENRNSSV